MTYEFLAGGYGTRQEETIRKYRFDSENVQLEKVWGINGIENPSYLLLHPNGNVLYSVEELTPEGRVAVYEMTEACPVHRYSLPSGGADPCHLMLSADSRYLTVANYTSGSLALFRVSEDGKTLEPADHKQHEGTGPNPVRQERAHVHFSDWIGDELYACDLGQDKVFCYHLDPDAGTLTEKEEAGIQVPAGYGPRHFAHHPAHPDFLYLLTELASHLLVYERTKTGWTLREDLPALPEDWQGESTAAAIHFDAEGGTLYTSNRGHDSIAAFFVGTDHMPLRAAISPAGGKTPRDFNLFGNHIIAAHQDSDTIRVLHREEDGSLTDTGVVTQMGRPVHIL